MILCVILKFYIINIDQKTIEDPLAEEIIKANIKEGDMIIIELNKEGNDVDIKVKQHKKTSPKKKED